MYFIKIPVEDSDATVEREKFIDYSHVTNKSYNFWGKFYKVMAIFMFGNIILNQLSIYILRQKYMYIYVFELAICKWFLYNVNVVIPKIKCM